MDSVEDRRIRCGHCKGVHFTARAVKDCANLQEQIDHYMEYVDSVSGWAGWHSVGPDSTVPSREDERWHGRNLYSIRADEALEDHR